MLESDRKSPTIDMLFRLSEAMSAALSAIIMKVEKAPMSVPLHPVT